MCKACLMVFQRYVIDRIYSDCFYFSILLFLTMHFDVNYKFPVSLSLLSRRLHVTKCNEYKHSRMFIKPAIIVEFSDKVRPQLVKSLVIVIRAHVLKVYNNYASTLIIYKVNRNFSFLPITYFP